MDNGTIFQLTTTHKAVVDLLVLGPTVVLPIAVNVLWQDATIVLPSCAGNVDHVVSDLYSKDCGTKNCKYFTTEAKEADKSSMHEEETEKRERRSLKKTTNNKKLKPILQHGGIWRERGKETTFQLSVEERWVIGIVCLTWKTLKFGIW